MAELNQKQIVDKLNTEFTGEHRKLVFWYDDKGDFAEDITTNYMIYAPFPKPPVTENHLKNTMLYSKRFYADRASLLSVDFGIENFNEENILTGIMCAVWDGI